ncbi:hypothetical protein PROFUN_08305 [Planoprotostelium fungivorum]|uniref:Carboxymuconolactone decarboxylase-like domain-containing protein n=1 Tax=Planoprotostelium fungivorum TaxID=1890364 RepID=A0A2P6NJZ7_9EUKA|nr:hypothetical protein PROFUN_08305 [Planoprotostelium fungivorum]
MKKVRMLYPDASSPTSLFPILSTVSIIPLNRPELTSELYKEVVIGLSHAGEDEIFTHARRMREALIKSWPLVGFPYVINCMHAFKSAAATSSHGQVIHHSKPKRPANPTTDPTEAMRLRLAGRGLFDNIYRHNSERVLNALRSSSSDLHNSAVEIAYGLVLSPSHILSNKETGLLELTGCVVMGCGPQAKGHMMGAKNMGATAEEVRAAVETAVLISRWEGKEAHRGLLRLVLAHCMNSSCHVIHHSKPKRPANPTTDPTEAMRLRLAGRGLFDNIYRHNSERVLNALRSSSSDLHNSAVEIAYGLVLSPSHILSDKETGLLELTGCVVMGCGPQAKGHMMGAKNMGATAKEVRAAVETAVLISQWGGKVVQRENMPFLFHLYGLLRDSSVVYLFLMCSLWIVVIVENRVRLICLSKIERFCTYRARGRYCCQNATARQHLVGSCSYSSMDPPTKRQRASASWIDFLRAADKAVVVFKMINADQMNIEMVNEKAGRMLGGLLREGENDVSMDSIIAAVQRLSLGRETSSRLVLSSAQCKIRLKKIHIDGDSHVLGYFKPIERTTSQSLIDVNEILFAVVELRNNRNMIHLHRVNDAARRFWGGLLGNGLITEQVPIGQGIIVPPAVISNYISSGDHLLSSKEKFSIFPTPGGTCYLMIKEITSNLQICLALKSEGISSSTESESFKRIGDLADSMMTAAMVNTVQGMRPRINQMIQVMSRMSERSKDIVDIELLDQQKKEATEMMQSSESDEYSYDTNVVWRSITPTEPPARKKKKSPPVKKTPTPRDTMSIRDITSPSPAIEGTNTHHLDVRWDQRQWIGFVIQCLSYFIRGQLPPEMSTHERLKLPENFGDIVNQIFGYLYKGIFFPSGNEDGHVWRPSQGTKNLRDGLQKRYFYATTSSGVKLTRHVYWMQGHDDWQLVEYRNNNHNGIVHPTQLLGPQGFDWHKLVRMSLK